MCCVRTATRNARTADRFPRGPGTRPLATAGLLGSGELRPDPGARKYSWAAIQDGAPSDGGALLRCFFGTEQ